MRCLMVLRRERIHLDAHRMANQNSDKADKFPPSNLQKYGVPFYAAAWVPYNAVRSKLAEDGDKSDEGESPSSASGNYVVLAGGGGEARSGIPNAIIISHVDLASNSLSDLPVAKLVIGSDLPYRMTVHPGGDGLICALPNGCRFFEWEEVESSRDHKLGVKESDKELSELTDVGQQLALAFDHEDSALAAGSEDGTLRVFKWPSMKTILNEAKVHASVKDLTFSSTGKFLASLGGPLCRVWDVSSKSAVATLSKEKDEVFAFCRFSQANGFNEVLYVAAMTDRGGIIIMWDTTSWNRLRSKRVSREAISAFNVSADGKFLALGTIEGNVLIVDSTSMQIRKVVKKAHLGLVTTLTFSPCSRALVSASMDSSARLTVIKETRKDDGMSLWVALFVLLLAIAVYLMKSREIIR